MPTPKVVAAKVADAAAKAVTKEFNKPGGITKVYPVSPTLKKFVGVGEISRTETLKKIWAYVREHNLQDPASKRDVVCDEKLKQILGKDKVHFSEFPGLLNHHFPPKKEVKKSPRKAAAEGDNPDDEEVVRLGKEMMGHHYFD